jgi:hypothetical protein
VENVRNSPFIAGNKKLFMAYNMEKHKSQEKIFWTQISGITHLPASGGDGFERLLLGG